MPCAVTSARKSARADASARSVSVVQTQSAESGRAVEAARRSARLASGGLASTGDVSIELRRTDAGTERRTRLGNAIDLPDGLRHRLKLLRGRFADLPTGEGIREVRTVER
jgi:hypothetical protein